MIRFDGQVAIVTGAGRGMGRVTAMSLAARGAKVVVNDFGGDWSAIGEGTSEVAEAVAEEIRASGGEAISDGNSVGTGDAATAIVNKAIETWGRVDVLVNNAGGTVVGDVHEFEDDEIMGVLGSNLLGPYMLTRRCWPHFQSQKYGRVVNVLSSGMLGQAQTVPYAAGKAGLFGLTTGSAVDGRDHNILVNGILPFGRSRLTDADDPAAARWAATYFKPELVAEATTYLASGTNTAVTGQFFSVGAGRVAKVAFYNAEGFHHPELTAEILGENIEAAQEMSDAVMVESSWDDNRRFLTVAPWTGGTQNGWEQSDVTRARLEAETATQ
ncbi:SDR family NAD(P)-dependent oxidoreductase [Aeromicrobium wangtongii]|uniref:SDR family NAD(P)-dependent oxidoreductase n=1 Tax=Aeromicrobium wangtongii TaxID=2969247 RepID=A0ABY5MF88_9ACTN|nr:SDR family NAD(P)-dependent oxidoreductase [Aeromicrobium wangtongii]MCD9197910.1 SDR family NAD(P)-dependent oxidoreductase [Aeromicrobium wangtongii]UUP15388.1 SDR family NAD(P)-dependent oxidoreductase [Aeromicrobium wangtongii]